ncbi:MAG: hypothetical protein EOP46_16785 [Sphingobacteriaceae bacterium]|nr:MAG: hypothetical protein EOP46_16785 [Sphingobacteriaceae bacterium]
MFTLFHFIFQLCKIAVQAAIYTGLLLFFIKQASNRRLRLIKFKPVYFSISALMLVFSFTYYGDHGLGDLAKIPLGYGKTMMSIDEYAFFEIDRENEIDVDSFLVRDNHLYFTSGNFLYDYNLPSGKWKKYDSRRDYEIYASAHHVQQISDFKTFNYQYSDYWDGWRFWLLP